MKHGRIQQYDPKSRTGRINPTDENGRGIPGVHAHFSGEMLTTPTEPVAGQLVRYDDTPDTTGVSDIQSPPQGPGAKPVAHRGTVATSVEVLPAE